MSYKTIRQPYRAGAELLTLMNIFKEMVNHCIRVGMENNCTTLKRLSSLTYNDLKPYQIASYYKLNAISQACGRLAQMKRQIKQGRKPKSPYVRKPYLVSSYGFKRNGMLFAIPFKKGEQVQIVLNHHTIDMLDSDPQIKIKSFTITPDSLSIIIKKDVHQITPTNVIGIDRNLRNITITAPDRIVQYRTELLSIKRNSIYARAGFKRNDRHVKGRFYQKIKSKQTRRVNQYLHKITKDIVQKPKQTNSAIVFEDLNGIRKLYRKGNGQAKKYRIMMNSWSLYMLLFQASYKAAREGISVFFVTAHDTSKLCPVCGGSLQVDRLLRRKVRCINCSSMMDRDAVASVNIACKGRSRFCRPRGLLDEATKRKTDLLKKEMLILQVNGSKLAEVC